MRDNWRSNITWLCVLSVVTLPASSALAGVDWIGVPVDPQTPMAFENPANWQADAYDPPPPDPPGPEQTPPGEDSTWFMEGFDGIVTLSQPRDGITGPKLGAIALGGGDAAQVQTLMISADVTFTGLERDGDGLVKSDTRELRVGREDDTPDDDQFPWGIVKQTTGTVWGEYATKPGDSDLKLSGDKAFSAGSIWEVGGDASLVLMDDILLGDKVVQAPGNVFRVRGSAVTQVTNGDKFKVASRTAVWEATLNVPEFGGRDQLNRGKSIVEFVLDAGGVTPIEVGDDLEIGDVEEVEFGRDLFTLGFLRVKLSEPTTAGSGSVESGDELVLFRADRITSGIGNTATELDEGRFFDPDRSGTGPHRAMLDGGTVIADYAGATYTWTINYFEGGPGVEDAVVLSNLSVDGSPGDYDGDGLDAKDIDQIQAARGTPIALASAQNAFDLNADDVVDHQDASMWVSHAAFAGTRFGDSDLDGDVDSDDYDTWQSNFGTVSGASWADGDTNGDLTVGGRDFLTWQSNFGGAAAAVPSAAPLPEPTSAAVAVLLALVASFAADWRRVLARTLG